MKQFDFNQVGKRMPYNVPDGFFDKFEEDVMQSLTPAPSLTGVRLLLSVAATLALFFVVHTMLPKSEPVLTSADEYASVELAFGQLSTDDQNFLIAVYEDEDYTNDLTYTEDYE